jgi:hypothetical protein
VALRHERRLPPSNEAAIASLPATFTEFCQGIKIKTLEGIKPFELLEWQRRFTKLILEDLATEKASISVVKSRQIGNTLLVLALELWLSLTIPQHTTLVLHLTYGDAWNLARRLRKLIKSLGIPLVTDSLSLIEFTNGSTIYFRSSDPETCGRGLENVDFVHVEEQGHQPHLRETLEVISPMRTWSAHSKLILIGTPNGKQLHYYSLLREVIGEGTIATTVEAIRAGEADPYQVFHDGNKYALLINWRTIQRFREERSPSFLERVKSEENLTEVGLLTEYELEFSESESAVFSPLLVRNSEAALEPVRASHHTGETWYEEPDESAIYYGGGDPNGGSLTSGDAASLVIIRKDGDRYRPAYIYRKKSGTSSAHISRWSDALKAFDPIATAVESNNTGHTWIEQLTALCPSQKIEGSKTTDSTRPALITLLTLALERGHLTLPRDSQISKELLAFIVSATGKPEAAPGSNDDVIFALMHALKAAKYGGLQNGFNV